MLSALSNDLNNTLGLGKTLVLVNEGLVNLGQMQFLLPVRKVLQIHEVPVRDTVGVLEDLVLLQVNLQGFCVWEVI
jgi:hypothetical protein